MPTTRGSLNCPEPSNAHLLDTHVIPWWLADSEHRALIEATETDPCGLAGPRSGRCRSRRKRVCSVDGDLVGSIQVSHSSILPITEGHVWAVELLPQHDADPFDRILVAQG